MIGWVVLGRGSATRADLEFGYCRGRILGNTLVEWCHKILEILETLLEWVGDFGNASRVGLIVEN